MTTVRSTRRRWVAVGLISVVVIALVVAGLVWPGPWRAACATTRSE
ncbi:MAG: hypothetical protein LBI33_13215 [Propionibacteriaceae bacterium]|jgi:ferric-dicitrate binding protein FerR (iron transport regulator)|nr:hypothetical protein [Propionibacteriaceae bacterium]